MTEGRGFHKFALAFVQSLPVLVVAYLFLSVFIAFRSLLRQRLQPRLF